MGQNMGSYTKLNASVLFDELDDEAEVGGGGVRSERGGFIWERSIFLIDAILRAEAEEEV